MNRPAFAPDAGVALVGDRAVPHPTAALIDVVERFRYLGPVVGLQQGGHGSLRRGEREGAEGTAAASEERLDGRWRWGGGGARGRRRAGGNGGHGELREQEQSGGEEEDSGTVAKQTMTK